MFVYNNYQKSLGEIPDFLNKYLDLSVMIRLKDVSLFCGMDYASKNIYDFQYAISRYDHSLNVALITWRLTHDKTQTLAALFHDVSTPVFSHVIDYMNGDYINQESTENKTREVLNNCKQLFIYLKEDGVNINDVINFKKYSVVDLPRPSLCADRIENIIGVGMSWVKELNVNDAIEIVNSMQLSTNEFNQQEISVSSLYVARLITYINNRINELTHSDEDTYMMMLLSDIVRRTINKGIITYNDLYVITEHDYMDILENNLHVDYELSDLWHHFKSVEKPVSKQNVKIKDLTINPIVHGKRIN